MQDYSHGKTNNQRLIEKHSNYHNLPVAKFLDLSDDQDTRANQVSDAQISIIGSSEERGKFLIY